MPADDYGNELDDARDSDAGRVSRPVGRAPGGVDPFAMFGSSVPEVGRIRRLGRQWWVVAATTAVAMLGGAVYLTSVPPTYTSTALLLIEPSLPPVLGDASATPVATPARTDHFLNTQCQVIGSTPVLALAVAQLGSLDSLSGVARPIPFLKDRVSVFVGATDDTVHVSASAGTVADANKIVSAVVDAYRAYQSNRWSDSARQVLTVLDAGRDAHSKEMAAKTKQLQDFVGAGAADSADSLTARQQVKSLSDALTAARIETVRAHDAYDGASRAIIGNPTKLAAVADLEQRTGSVADPAAALARIQSDLTEEQSRLVDAGRQYLPGHPIMKSIQQRIDLLTVSAVAAAEQWWDDAQAREQDLQKSLADAREQDLAQQTRAAEYARLSSEVDRLRKMDDVLDGRMKEIDLARGAGAMNISVLQPAEIVGPPKPEPVRALVMTAGVGLLAGLALALVRDGRDDRLRSPLAVQASLQLPVVASVPAIVGPRTAADRSQIVHHDPFSPAAESYRTLQTALQYGLPAGTKTILITSPASGDGKSTLISNLAVAMAQAGKRVLIADADFRAPMQHRLFGLKDRTGLTTLIAGDASIDNAVQRTGIERVSLLPCGPTPTNPAETLNDPALSELLADLADQFDFVLVDSPPVTAVADARILATLCDVSLLVLRANHSTRRLAVQSRDALRSVGAKLVGVAINGVHAGGEFAVTPGYSARPAVPVESAAAPAHASPRALALAATALKSGPRKRHRA